MCDYLMTRALDDGRDWQSGKKHPTGQPGGSEEDMDCVRQAFIWSLKKSIS